MKYCSKVTDILGDLHIYMKYIKVLILFSFGFSLEHSLQGSLITEWTKCLLQIKYISK